MCACVHVHVRVRERVCLFACTIYCRAEAYLRTAVFSWQHGVLNHGNRPGRWLGSHEHGSPRVGSMPHPVPLLPGRVAGLIPISAHTSLPKSLYHHHSLFPSSRAVAQLFVTIITFLACRRWRALKGACV